MPLRHISERVLEFQVPCLLRRGSPAMRKELKANGESGGIGPATFKNTVAVYAKTAAVQQGWYLEDKECVYIIITINIEALKRSRATNPDKKTGSRKRIVERDKKKLKQVFYGTPELNTMLRYILLALKGIIYTKNVQLVAVTCVKRYSRNFNGIEIQAGVPKEWSELSHDLRNA